MEFLRLVFTNKRSRKKMETFWFFQLRFRRAYDSAYDSRGGGGCTPGNSSWGCAARFFKSWPDQNGQSVYPFSDQNGAKNPTRWGGNTYMAYIREYPTRVTTSIFHFHQVISALPTPLTNPTPSWILLPFPWRLSLVLHLSTVHRNCYI